MRQLLFWLALAAASIVGSALSAENDRNAAEEAADTWLKSVDTGYLPEAYDELAGPSFKNVVSREIFEQNTGILRIQFGGPASSRVLVGEQFFQRMPTGMVGQFYYFRYLANYPAGAVFQDVYLEWTDDKWLVSGFYIFPAPMG